MTPLIVRTNGETLRDTIIGQSGISTAVLEESVNNKQDSPDIPIRHPTPVE